MAPNFDGHTSNPRILCHLHTKSYIQETCMLCWALVLSMHDITCLQPGVNGALVGPWRWDFTSGCGGYRLLGTWMGVLMSSSHLESGTNAGHLFSEDSLVIRESLTLIIIASFQEVPSKSSHFVKAGGSFHIGKLVVQCSHLTNAGVLPRVIIQWRINKFEKRGVWEYERARSVWTFSPCHAQPHPFFTAKEISLPVACRLSTM